MKIEEFKQIDRMFNPKSMAVIGAVGRPGSFGHLTFINQISFGYKGKLYPVSTEGGEIAGMKVYKNIQEIEGSVDLASIAVPARFVPSILKECLEHGLAGAEVMSSGFAETGLKEGIALQRQMEEIAAQGLRIVGPNCFGIHSTSAGITLPPGGMLSNDPGPIALISQSGGMALNFAFGAQNMGLKLSKVISYGNGCDLNAVDLLEYLALDDQTKYVGAYIEGVSNGQAFVKALKNLAATKPTVIWKGGLTPLGDRAAKSHTGSLAGESKIWESVLRQPGVASVQGLSELLDALSGLNYLKNQGPDIALVGGGGAIGVFSSDLASRLGLNLPIFSKETQDRLSSRFPTPGNSVLNPLDTGTPALPLEFLLPMLEDLMVRENFNVMVVVMLLHAVTMSRPASPGGEMPPPSPEYLEKLLDFLLKMKDQTGKDVAMVFENPPEDPSIQEVAQQVAAKYHQSGIPVFSSMERAMRGIKGALSAASGPKERP